MKLKELHLGRGHRPGFEPLQTPQGDADELVPVTNTRQWADAMKDLQMDDRYDEIRGAAHGSVIEKAIPDIFAFFQAHAKK